MLIYKMKNLQSQNSYTIRNQSVSSAQTRRAGKRNKKQLNAFDSWAWANEALTF